MNSDISKIQPKFAEYEQQLKENGFTFYKVYSNHYTYIKDDIYETESFYIYVSQNLLSSESNDTEYINFSSRVTTE